MFGLHGWLLAKGQISFINEHVPGSDHVVIKPEIVPLGNPTNASKVVRWILQKPNTVSAIAEDGTATKGPTEFPGEDIWSFSRMYYEVPDRKYMFLPILNTHLFRHQRKNRTKTAYFVGKGIDTHKHPKGAIEITREKAQDQDWLADLLNECKVLYQYDPVSAISEIARLCGCPVILNQTWFTEKKYELYEPGLEGVSFNNKIKKFDIEQFRAHYQELRYYFSRKLDSFIEVTQR